MTARIYAVGITTVGGSRVYSAGFTTVSASSSRPKVYSAGFTSNVSHPQIYSAGFTTSGSPVSPIVDTIPAQTVDGWETVTITPHASPTPDTWIYTVISGTVTLTGTGTSRSFTAPAVFDGMTVQIGVQASKGGVLSQQQVATFTVKPWSSFILTASGWSLSDVVDGGTAASTPADLFDGGSGINTQDTFTAGTAAVPAADLITGGTASVVSVDLLSGGTAASVPSSSSGTADVLDGNGNPKVVSAWTPRRPLTPI